MKYKIIGCGESKFSAAETELNLEEMVYNTVKKALADAKLDIKDIDTVLQAGDDVLDGININHVYIVEPAGSFLKEESKIEEDGAFALFYALCRLGSNKYNTAMVVAYSKASETSISNMANKAPYSDPEVSGDWYYHSQLDPFYMRPLGIDVTSYHAMQYSAFLNNSKLSEADIAKVVSKNKIQGKSNSNAPFSGDIDVDEIMNSKYISTPVKNLEVPPQTDGVSVLIVSTEDWAKENNRTGNSITGVGSATDAYYPGYRDFHRAPSAEISATKALKMANKKQDDIDVAEIYDLFSYQEPLLYHELFGWSYEQIKKNIDSAFTSATGELPVNLSGGILCGHPILAAGLSRIIHLDKIMKEKDYKCGLAHSQSGMGLQSNIVYIIEK